MDIKDFRRRHAAILPTAALPVIDRYLENTEHQNWFGGNTHSMAGAIYLVGVLTMLVADVGEALIDLDAHGARLGDRAFVHLRRMLVADAEVRAKWQRAYKEGETACECLGAAHLLAHGIWAFKAHAEGGRTDLILGGPPRLDEAERAADALALTEWKLVSARNNATQKLDEAIAQAKRYTEETLAGFEIASRRYAVLVSKQDHPSLPHATERDGHTYQTVLVQVNPEVPSKAAKRRGQ